MDNLATKQWLKWITTLQAIAQTGLTYTKDPFDIERYHALREIAAEMAAHEQPAEIPKIFDLFAAEKGYPTPKLDVRGAVFSNDKILLVKERSDSRWALPGGWGDINLSPSQAVTKEIYEESGYETQTVKLIAIYDKQKHNHPIEFSHIYKCFFLCTITGGHANTSIETSEIGFFDENLLPELSPGRVTEEQIKRCFAHARNPSLPTEFD